MRQIALAVLLVVVVLALPAAADITHINWDGTGDQMTIWAGALLAGPGDTVLVAPGVYDGTSNTDINTQGTNVVFASEGGAAVTFIDGGDEHGVFRITDGQDSTFVVRGFTLTNCHPSTGSGAMEISNSSPIIEDCVFEGCTANSNGGGIGFSNSSAIVRDCVFRGNTGDYRGGGIYAYNGALTVSCCLFDGNTASSTYEGGAVFSNSSSDVYSGCTFVDNESDAVRVYNAPDLRVTNCIIAATVGGCAVYQQDSDEMEVSHCVVFGNADGDSLPAHHHDNLFVDPLFCDVSTGDYTHCSDSECLPPYNGWGELVGVYGEGCDACNTPVENASWGEVKALFR
ncbi:MAG: right-handed parallel beta-helix repeat-containing protein [Candidatus Eisenbacteria bacterium]|nr:right-handed parallel beta-helix repeat-containing protein [Candidatus Eisenbacteria bacterium]